MSGFAYLAVVVDGGSGIDNRQVAERGVRIDYGPGHYRHPAPETHSGGDDSLGADRVDEFKSERRYSRGYFSTQRIVAERDKAVPDALRVEVRQNIITAQYRGAHHVSSLRLTVRTTNHIIAPLGSDQFYHHFRVAARTDQDHRCLRWCASPKSGV